MIKILSGNDLSEELYLKTWELDNKVFEEKDRLTKKEALDLFYRSNKSTIVLYDDSSNDLIGYILNWCISRNNIWNRWSASLYDTRR